MIAEDLLSFTHSQSPDSLYKTLSDFEIDQKIGRGQFSVVYKARCKANNTAVALKKIQIFEMTDSKARIDCIKEINLLQVERLNGLAMELNL